MAMKKRTSTHHICFPRTIWTAHADLNRLRTWLTVELPDKQHAELHATIGYIPPLPVDEAQRLWQKVKNLSNATLEIRLWAIIREVEYEAEQASDYYIQRMLLLTAHGLNEQLSLLAKWKNL